MENWKIQIGANNFRVKHLAFHRALALGMTYIQFAEFFSTIGFHLPHKSTFYKFQKGSTQNIGWCDVASRVWDNKKHKLQNELRAIDLLFLRMWIQDMILIG
jgi:hypothetical protein